VSPSQSRTQLKVVAGLTAEDGAVRFLPRVRVQIIKGTCPTEGSEVKVPLVAGGETSLRGELIVVLPPGAYRLCAADTTTPKHYRWNLAVEAKGKSMAIELSDANAVQATVSGGSSGSGGVIEGDVYLLMKSGDLRKGAGLTVHLTRDPEAVSKLLAENCDQYQRPYDELNKRLLTTSPRPSIGEMQQILKQMDQLGSRPEPDDLFVSLSQWWSVNLTRHRARLYAEVHDHRSQTRDGTVSS
jgi:hypothetical protein